MGLNVANRRNWRLFGRNGGYRCRHRLRFPAHRFRSRELGVGHGRGAGLSGGSAAAVLRSAVDPAPAHTAELLTLLVAVSARLALQAVLAGPAFSPAPLQPQTNQPPAFFMPLAFNS